MMRDRKEAGTSTSVWTCQKITSPVWLCNLNSRKEKKRRKKMNSFLCGGTKCQTNDANLGFYCFHWDWECPMRVTWSAWCPWDKMSWRSPWKELIVFLFLGAIVARVILTAPHFVIMSLQWRATYYSLAPPGKPENICHLSFKSARQIHPYQMRKKKVSESKVTHFASGEIQQNVCASQ